MSTQDDNKNAQSSLPEMTTSQEKSAFESSPSKIDLQEKKQTTSAEELDHGKINRQPTENESAPRESETQFFNNEEKTDHENINRQPTGNESVARESETQFFDEEKPDHGNVNRQPMGNETAARENETQFLPNNEEKTDRGNLNSQTTGNESVARENKTQSLSNNEEKPDRGNLNPQTTGNESTARESKTQFLPNNEKQTDHGNVNRQPMGNEEQIESRKIVTSQDNYHGNSSTAQKPQRRHIPISGSHAPKINSSLRPIIERNVQLPNGKQNEFYEVNLAELPQFADLDDFNIHDGQKTELKLCPDTYVLGGVISQNASDECRLIFYGKDKNQVTVKITALLIVNPDPKTLWKKVEPTSPFFRKPHQHFERIEGKYGILTAARIRGRSHAQRGAFCEDDFSVMTAEKLGYFGMVADGAGSAKFSRLGSKLLAESLPRFLQHFIYQQLAANDNFKRWEKFLLGTPEEQKRALNVMKGIFTNALRHSAHTLHQHTLISLKDEQTKENIAIRFRDLYSTCLAFWAYPLENGRRWALASYWVGDGGLAVGHGGQFSLLGMPDGGEFSGQTRFFADEELTDSALEKRLRANIYEDLESVWAFSDGVTDPKFASERQLENSQVWQDLTAEISPHLVSRKSILEWLAFWSQGEHDDRSLCVFEVKGKNNE